jgi:hypothetical protein
MAGLPGLIIAITTGGILNLTGQFLLPDNEEGEENGGEVDERLYTASGPETGNGGSAFAKAIRPAMADKNGETGRRAFCSFGTYRGIGVSEYRGKFTIVIPDATQERAGIQ